jgi:hypothetical protein
MVVEIDEIDVWSEFKVIADGSIEGMLSLFRCEYGMEYPA